MNGTDITTGRNEVQAALQRLSLNRFIVLGRVGMDLNADPPGTRIDDARAFTTSLGGSAGNIAVALARQGAGVALLSCVSDDAVGRWCLAELVQHGVDPRYVRKVASERRTSLALTETVAEGCQTVLYRNGAADFALQGDDIGKVRFEDVGALVVTGTAFAAEPSRTAAFAAIAAATAHGVLSVLDIDYRAYSWTSEGEAARICRLAAEGSDIVVGNDVEFGLLAGSIGDGPSFAADLVRKGALFSVYKRGPAGSVTFTQGRQFETPVFPVVALKPTGAGDGFMGGLLAGLAQGYDLERSVARGAATAALVVTGIGCSSASPDTAALEAFLSRF